MAPDKLRCMAFQRGTRYHSAMSYALTGILHGRTIELDQSESALEGMRVRIVIEPLVQDVPRLSQAENARLLKEWAARGPQGPIDDDGSDFPR